MNIVAEFSIPYHQVLNKDAVLVDELPGFAKDSNLLIALYERMVLARVFDQKAVALQRTGQLGTYPSILGQESIGVPMGILLEQTDVLAPYYRDQAAQMGRGVSMKDILLVWGGHERGNLFSGEAKEDLPNAIPIATQITHAAGIASAFKIRGEKRVVLTSCGDGATSRGDFLESINLAGVWNLPMVIIVNNNQWAISVPLEHQTAAKTIAQKAISAGITGEQVDGNDVIAVYKVLQQALSKARAGKGPTLIEAVSYRLSDHTTADDATRYRSNDEVKEAWKAEPIKRLQTYLVNQNFWDEEKELALQQSCTETVAKAVDEYLKEEPEDPMSMFDYLYETLPYAMEKQKHFLSRRIKAMKNGGVCDE